MNRVHRRVVCAKVRAGLEAFVAKPDVEDVVHVEQLPAERAGRAGAADLERSEELLVRRAATVAVRFYQSVVAVVVELEQAS